MKFILFTVLCISALVVTQPTKNAEILSYRNELGIGGEYEFEFDTSDGIYRHETSRIVKGPDGTESQVVEGTYWYTGDDGKLYTVKYIADKDGYRLITEAQVAHFPPGLAGSLIGGGLG